MSENLLLAPRAVIAPCAQRLAATGWALNALAVLFAARVAGQAVQRWLDLPFLPPFAAFQGSALPYAVLLPAQLAILALMLHLARRVLQGSVRPRPRVGRALLALGSLYFVTMLARLVIGMSAPDASAWFRSTIPAAFHLILATYVLVLARWHAADVHADAAPST